MTDGYETRVAWQRATVYHKHSDTTYYCNKKFKLPITFGKVSTDQVTLNTEDNLDEKVAYFVDFIRVF